MFRENGQDHEHVTAKLRLMEERCRQNGLSLTVQRRTILENLASRSDHPTADQVYAAIKDRISGVSRTTVYRVLETFVQLGLAKKISNPEARARFDAETTHHHHASCVACERVFDIDGRFFPELVLDRSGLEGFAVIDCSVVVTGLCRDCAADSGLARSITFN